MVIATSKSLLPIVTSLRGPSSLAHAPAVADAPATWLPAVNSVAVPVPLVCLIRIVPADVFAFVVSVSLVSSASETVIHAVTSPDSV